MNQERLLEVAQIIEKLAPHDDVDEKRITPAGGYTLVKDAGQHAPISHLHMGIYHGTLKCDTLGCIAGVTIHRWADEAKKHANPHRGLTVVDKVAGNILDLTIEERGTLFHCDGLMDGIEVKAVLPNEAAEACRRLAAGRPLGEVWQQNATRETDNR